MARKKERTIRPLGEDLLKSVVGGQGISKIPDPFRPRFHVPASIAQGDTLDNTLTMDQLP